MLYRFIPFIILILVSGCSRQNDVTGMTGQLQPDTTIHYAQRFAIAREGNATWVFLRGNRNSRDTTAVFVLSRDTSILKVPSNVRRIQVPCRRVAALSSIYYAMLCALGASANIAAIDNIDYASNSYITEAFGRGKITELMRNPDLDLEMALKVQPDILFMFGMGTGDDIPPKVRLSGLPVAVSVDHLEVSPLARAEWIRFYGLFVDREARADSIFRSVETNYLRTRTSAQRAESKPGVFTEVRLGDTWYMPGGKSYVATLIGDAGGRYMWSHDTSFGSIPLTFEQVLRQAKDADYWINLSMVRTRADLLNMDPRYAHFRAFGSGNLFNNTRYVNANGYSTYWETGMMYPDRILQDLVQIFAGRGDTDSLYYYRRLP